MNQRHLQIYIGALLVALLTSVASAQNVQIRLSDGSTWRGEIGQNIEVTYMERGVERSMRGTLQTVKNLYIIVDGKLDLQQQRKVIPRGDLRSIKTVTEEARDRDSRERESTRPRDRQQQPAEDYDGPGVIVLPLTGPVGVNIRHQEIEAVGKKADELGPGQTIILDIETGGGLVTEMEQIARVIQDIKRRHRVIAWIREAISAGCATAIQCEEIYFRTMGTAGSMTAFAGTQSWQGAELQMWMRRAGEWMQEGGRDPRIAHAMIHAPVELSYDKNYETGEVTFYSDLRGEYILSRAGDNLTFTSDQAVHSGFANGIADTKEELAELLDMPKWHEVTDYGRRIHAEYIQLVERAEADLDIRLQRLSLQYEGSGTGDQMVVLQRRLQNLRAIRRWCDRAPNVTQARNLSPEGLDEAIRELERQIRRMQQ